ncbi:hypothetical protein BCR33DRAFT_785390 [Rhizoclosmatium globosum]|uniref:G-protein coupled receptors family 1 profile domain-containing protein n=1 Tax=Rhizoclosmatium globosum TaxID=329046 RepID=A0A1Y2CAU8_9FUNG|nr:hypothetical protein BCR33DRAFT_785390 [Rhizoclosmatium globosum]|eukprot:ORY44163.1 hypothetical protein BCR33DRAFT_785390 [Rhizoclosmatium globosum]
MGSPQTYSSSSSQTYCSTSWKSRDPKAIVMITANIIAVSLPLIFVVYAYTSIFLKMQKSVALLKADSESGVNGQNLVSKAEVNTHDKKPATIPEKEQNNLLTQSIVLVSASLIGWAPIFAVILYAVITGDKVPPVVDYVGELFIMLQAVFNPVYLMCRNRELRKCVGKSRKYINYVSKQTKNSTLSA